jgi:hypothetical protein
LVEKRNKNAISKFDKEELEEKETEAEEHGDKK